MKKRIFIISLALTMALSMSACGSKKENNETSEPLNITEGKMKAGTSVNNNDNNDAGTVENTAAKSTSQSSNSFVGYYKLIKFISNGEDITGELQQINEYGVGIYMVVNEDGTGHVNMMGEKTDFTWDEKFVHIEDIDTPYTFDNGTVVLAMDADEMTFEPMTEEEKLAYDKGDYDKTVDDIADEMIDQAFGEATDSLNEAAKDATEGLSDAYEEGTDALNNAMEDAKDSFDNAVDDATNSLTGSLTGSLKGDKDSSKADTEDSKDSNKVEFDSSYLPDLSSGKHNDAGYYEIMAFQESGTTYNADALAKAGVEFDMMLCPDGKGYAHFIGTYYDLSWDDGTIYVATDEGQQKMIYFSQDYDDRHIISISDANMAMVFQLVKDADSTYEWKGGSGLKPE